MHACPKLPALLNLRCILPPAAGQELDEFRDKTADYAHSNRWDRARQFEPPKMGGGHVSTFGSIESGLEFNSVSELAH